MVLSISGLLLTGCAINAVNEEAEVVKTKLKSRGVEVEHGEVKKVYRF